MLMFHVGIVNLRLMRFMIKNIILFIFPVSFHLVCTVNSYSDLFRGKFLLTLVEYYVIDMIDIHIIQMDSSHCFIEAPK